MQAHTNIDTDTYTHTDRHLHRKRHDTLLLDERVEILGLKHVP